MGYETDPDGGTSRLDPATTVTETPAVFEPTDTSREAIESRVSDRLAALRDEPADEDIEEKPADAGTVTDESAENKTEEQNEQIEAVADPSAPTLPAAVRRSLKAYEWTDEEIDQNLKVMGPSFIATAQKLHNTRNQETAKWAEIGRSQRQQTQQTAAEQPKDEERGKPIAKLDAAALKEHYGDDALIDKILGPVNAAIDRINNEIMPTVQHTQQAAQQAEQRALFNHIEGFFGSKDMKGYTDLYGKVEDPTFSKEHLNARNKVLELADALISGAAKQGRNLNLNEALTLSHDMVSGGHKEKAAKQQLQASLQKRERGISLKPGSKIQQPSANGKKDRSEIEKTVGKRLAAVFASA